MQRVGYRKTAAIFARSYSYNSALTSLISKTLLQPAKRTVRLFSMPSSGRDPADEATASASAPAPEVPAGSTSGSASEPELPPLTPQEFRIYNRLSETMEYFHDHFRKTWNLLYNACKSGKRPANMTLKQFLDEGLSLVRYLETHHNIEETYLFPLLARKMPEFRAGKGGGAGELVRQHQLIHAGMDGFEEYLRQCRAREIEFELPVMKTKMDSWGDVLLTHLDQEVQTLRAENMRRYWTAAEIKAIPI